MSQLSFVAENILVGYLEEKLSSLVSDFGRVFVRRRLKTIVGKSRTMKFSVSHRQEPVRVIMGLEELEEVSEFKYL